MVFYLYIQISILENKVKTLTQLFALEKKKDDK